MLKLCRFAALTHQPGVRRTIVLAFDAMRWLAEEHDNQQGNKVKVYETMMLNIMCYYSETCILTAEMNRQLRVFEKGCLRRIMGVSRQDHIRNEHMRAHFGIKEDIVGRIHDHVVRMDNCRRPNIALYGRVERSRARG